MGLWCLVWILVGDFILGWFALVVLFVLMLVLLD